METTQRHAPMPWLLRVIRGGTIVSEQKIRTEAIARILADRARRENPGALVEVTKGRARPEVQR